MQCIRTALLLAAAASTTHALRVFRGPAVSAPVRRVSAVHASTVWYEGALERRPLIAGNWKLNPQSANEARTMLKLLAANQRAFETSGRSDLPNVAIFPPYPYLEMALQLLQGTAISVGAQNIGVHTMGAFTGEVSAQMVRSLGCEYVLLGHSERRSIFLENDVTINDKMHLALDAGLKVVLCVGETEAEFESGLLQSVCELQLKKGLFEIGPSYLLDGMVTIAYEPVWAIGTGKVATPNEAQHAHSIIRAILAEMYTPETSRQIVVQYGGSVTPETIDELMRMPDVDGALVGGASLDASKFARIVEYSPPNRPRGQLRQVSAREVVSCQNGIGESPVWSAREGRLYWCSASDEEVWSWDGFDAPRRWVFDGIVGCVALKQGGGLLLGLEGSNPGIASWLPGQVNLPEIICPTPESSSVTRPNDARVDRSGNLVFGMYNNYHKGGASVGEDNAGLYRLTQDEVDGPCTCEEILSYRFRCSNAICFSPDGSQLYFCDSPTRKIYAFEYSPADGIDMNTRQLIYTQPAALAGNPDGAQVDSAGFIWVALSGAGLVVRINPSDGSSDLAVTSLACLSDPV